MLYGKEVVVGRYTRPLRKEEDIRKASLLLPAIVGVVTLLVFSDKIAILLNKRLLKKLKEHLAVARETGEQTVIDAIEEEIGRVEQEIKEWEEASAGFRKRK